jgi:protein-disulfide isomerase-like protein with CxxC motif
MSDAIRDALTKAYDSTPSTDEPSSTDATTNTPLENTALSSDTAVDEGTSTETPEVPSGTEGTSAAPAAPAAPAQDDVRAPASWTPAEREGWAQVPPSAKQAILRREREANAAFQHSASARRFQQAVSATFEPYAELMQKHNATPEAAMRSLLATRAALELGSDEQKADLVANIISDFGINIELLDAAITAGVSGQRPQVIQAPPVDYRQVPELAPLFGLAEQVTQQRRAAAATALSEVQTKDHYEAVRFDMADIIQKAAERGRSVSVTDAYDIACRMNGLHVEPTAQAATVSASQAASILAKSRVAASSVGGAPRPTPPKEPASVREAVEAAMNRR